MRTRALLLITATAATLSACRDSASPSGPRPVPPAPPALQVGRWNLTTADSRPLPVVLAQRAVNGGLEQLMLDSASLLIRHDGTYEQRIWTRVERNGQPHGSGGQVDAGRWRVDNGAYRFTSSTGQRALTVRNPSGRELRVTEPIATELPDDIVISGVYVPAGDAVTLISVLYDGREVHGTISPITGRVRLLHGLTPSDSLLDVGYERTP